MRKKLKIAILGATGVVGRNMLSELEKSGLDIAEIKLLASKRSVGRKMLFQMSGKLKLKKRRIHHLEGWMSFLGQLKMT